jgi:hypothetical protein
MGRSQSLEKESYRCTNKKIGEEWDFDSDEDKKDALIYSYSEGGWFEVGENFGCVHWESLQTT